MAMARKAVERNIVILSFMYCFWESKGYFSSVHESDKK